MSKRTLVRLIDRGVLVAGTHYTRSGIGRTSHFQFNVETIRQKLTELTRLEATKTTTAQEG